MVPNHLKVILKEGTVGTPLPVQSTGLEEEEEEREQVSDHTLRLIPVILLSTNDPPTKGSTSCLVFPSETEPLSVATESRLLVSRPHELSQFSPHLIHLMNLLQFHLATAVSLLVSRPQISNLINLSSLRNLAYWIIDQIPLRPVWVATYNMPR